MDDLDLEQLAKDIGKQENDATINDLIRLTAINSLLDMKKNGKVNSRLNKKQVLVLTKLELYSKQFENSFTKLLADTVLNLQVSLGGAGRKELVEILKTSDNNYFSDTDNDKVKDVFR